MKRFSFLLFIVLFLFASKAAFAYDVRAVNLGTTHFLDGMPLPAGAGWYVRQYLIDYTSNRLTTITGNTLITDQFSSLASLTHIIYQSKVEVLGGYFGADTIIPYVFDLHMDSNLIGLTSSGSGFDDLLAGPFIQWNPIMLKGRPFFANRLEVDVYFPTGKFTTDHPINPGFGFYSVEPYWAATIFLVPRWTVSWRAHLLFNQRNRKTDITSGDTFHINFASSVALIPHRLRVGMSGYYLKQLENSRFRGEWTPNSREQVFAIGPGILVVFNKRMFLSFHAYFESLAENRPEGNRYAVSFMTKL